LGDWLVQFSLVQFGLCLQLSLRLYVYTTITTTTTTTTTITTYLVYGPRRDDHLHDAQHDGEHQRIVLGEARVFEYLRGVIPEGGDANK
jgi:hypothetical protein